MGQIENKQQNNRVNFSKLIILNINGNTPTKGQILSYQNTKQDANICCLKKTTLNINRYNNI